MMLFPPTTIATTGVKLLAVVVGLSLTQMAPVQASFERVHQDVLSGLPTFGVLFKGAVFFDFDNDGHLDVFLCNYDPENDDPALEELPPSAFSQRLLRRTVEGEYIDVSVEAGINTESPDGCGSALSADFDNDGDQDLVTSLFSPSGGCVLWENHGDGTFSSHPLEGCGSWQGGLGADDVDGDGLLDIYSTHTNAIAPDLPNIPSTMLRNLGGLQFAVQPMTGTEDVLYPCDASFADLDDDGDADLIVLGCNEISSSLGPLPGPLYLFRNIGNFEFVQDNAGFGVPDLPYGFWMSTAFGDANNDGHLDIYVGNVGCVLGTECPDVLQHALLLNNGDGTYTNIAQEAGLANERFNWVSAFVDVDNDGFQDLITVGNLALPEFFLEPTLAGVPIYSPGAVFKNDHGSLPFILVEEFGIVTGWGLAVGDFDNDGYEDVCIQVVGLPVDPINESPDAVLLRNNPQEEDNNNNWIKVQLEGSCSNRDGIGAKVIVHYKYRSPGQDDQGAWHQAKQVKFVASGSSSQSSHDKVLTFGLGYQGTVTRIAVQWPDQGGKQQIVGDVGSPMRSNTLVHIVQNQCN